MALLFVPINSTRRESSSPASTGSSESESEEQEAEEDYQPVVVATDTNHFHLRDQSRVECTGPRTERNLSTTAAAM